MNKHNLCRLTWPLLLLCLLLVLCCCGKQMDSDEKENVTSSTAETAAPINQICLDGYTIVRPDDGGTDKLLIPACSAWLSDLKRLGNTTMNLSADWFKGYTPGQYAENDEKEILVGPTNRKESQQALAELKSDADYLIRRVGQKILILGKTDKATCRALEAFRAAFTGENGSLTVPEDLNIFYTLAGEGSPLMQLVSEYTIVRSEDLNGAYAIEGMRLLRDKLTALTGVSVKLRTDRALGEKTNRHDVVNGEKEILLGQTNRQETTDMTAGLGALDYVIGMTDNKIVICGGTPTATIRAVEKFIELLTDGALTSLEAGTLSFRENFWEIYEINPYVQDPESFVPVWQKIYTIPDWMRDFGEKTYAITQNNLRNMSVAHRGDWGYYPENSLEGYLSAIAAGCDVMEIDVRETKDHVLILMHDETLKRTTDWSVKQGKNGLPSSEYVKDWTYEQLRSLRLKTSGGSVTAYQIPTLYEAMAVMKDHCFIHVDNKTGKFAYSDDGFLLAQSLGCPEIFFYICGLSTMRTWATRMDDPDFTAYVNTCMKYMQSGALRPRYWCDDNASATSYAAETPARFEALRAQGKTLLWSNRIVAYCQYIAENFSAAKAPF